MFSLVNHPALEPVVADAERRLCGAKPFEHAVNRSGLDVLRPGIVMVVYLDEAFDRHMREGRIRGPEDVAAAVVEGAAARVRPLVMTVATTVLGLLPMLWEAGVGADVTARTAAPVVGGLWSCMVLTLLVLPAAYTIWRRHQVRVAMTVSLPHGAAPSEGAA